jgi:hypothetical protein
MRVRQHQALVGVALLAVTGFALSGCSSGTSQASIEQTCQNVSAVLADGPDPDADPVGYALAQVMPLKQIHTSDSSLQQAIDNLASAYELFYQTKGSSSAQHAVDQAGSKLNAICPGATS